jgi:hypothetical protein
MISFPDYYLQFNILFFKNLIQICINTLILNILLIFMNLLLAMIIITQ